MSLHAGVNPLPIEGSDGPDNPDHSQSAFYSTQTPLYGGSEIKLNPHHSLNQEVKTLKDSDNANERETNSGSSAEAVDVGMDTKADPNITNTRPSILTPGPSTSTVTAANILNTAITGCKVHSDTSLMLGGHFFVSVYIYSHDVCIYL